MKQVNKEVGISIRGYTIIEIVLIAVFFILLSFLVPFSAYQEAKQFNRFSTEKITWWDALWAEYRILPTD